MNIYRKSELPEHLQRYFEPAELGLEPTPAEYVEKMVAVFREVRRVLRDDGTLWLNLASSYFGGGRGGGGSFESERPGRREVPCGTSGKAPANSQARDCLCGSLCDACRVAYQTGKSHSDGRRVPMQETSPFETSREHTESLSAHLPTLGSSRQVDRTADAIPDLGSLQAREGERLPVSQETTNVESSPQPCAPSLEVSSQGAGCRLCGRSLQHYVPASARKAACNCDNVPGASAGCTQGKDVSDLAYLDFTRVSFKPKDMVPIPWMVAMALQADGWYLRQDIIWAKPNPMPESVQGTHYSRHRVTIAEYENLSGMRYEGERAGDDWAGDMPSLSEGEISHRKAPLSAKQKRQGDDAGTRGSSGSYGKAAAAISGGSDTPSTNLTQQGRTARESDESELALCPVAEGQGQKSAGLREPERCPRPGAIHSGGLDRVGPTEQESLLLLQAAEGADPGSCNPGEQGREARQGEHSASVPELQFDQEGQDRSTLLVGCPGCAKCEMHHGYTFHLSAGRCTKAHEYLFLLAKSAKYFYDADAISQPAAQSSIDRLAQPNLENQAGSDRVPGKTNGPMKAVFGGRNKHAGYGTRIHSGREDEGNYIKNGVNRRSVWTVTTKPFKGAHFATFPPKLIEPCILAGCPAGGVVLDPFGGAGTTGLVANQHGRDAILIELNPEYAAMAERRIAIASVKVPQ